MASNRSKSKVLQNAQKAFRYSAVPVVKDKMPYATGTVKSVVEVSKDLRDWTIRNNPFRAVNGNRDPLIRQIANVAVRSVKDAKRDLLSGDLTFRRLNKTVMDFVGGGDPMDDLDFNFDFDFGDGTFSDSGSDDQTSNANFAIADNLSRDFAETQMHATSAMIGSVEHATNKINKTTMAMTDSAVTRLITSNMTIAARSSAQLGTISAGIETVNKNISLLVEQGNAVTGFISQAQRYMETSEQNLNDIKALLTEMVRPAKKKGYSPEEAPEFMQGRFDIKKYAEYIFNDSALGPVLSSVVGTTFKSLKLELPSFIDDMWAQPLSELNPLKTAIEKLLPAVGRLSNLDKMVDRVFQSFMAKLDNGEYGGFLNGLGLYGFGFKNTYNKRFYGSNYEKGTVTWNGKSERALQEVIPSYLANIEGYLKDIAIHTSADTKYQLDKKNVRHYNYDSGEFQTFAEIQARAMRDMNDAVQSSFAGTTEMLEKMVETNEESRKEFSELLQNIMSAENADITSKKEWKEAVYNAVSKYRLNDDIIEANIDQLLQQIIDDRGSAIIAMNNLRSAAGRRDNYLYQVGNEITYDKNGNPIGINKYSPTLVYDSADRLKEAKRDRMTAEERRRAEMEDAQKEKQKGFKDQAVAKLKSSEFGTGLYNAYELFKKKGGPINQSIDFVNAQLQGALVRLVHRLPSYDVGSDNIASNQVATVHKGEIVVRKEIADKIRAGQFDDSVASWFKEVSGVVPDFNNQNMREAVGTLIGGKNQRGKVQGAVLDSTKEYYRVAIDADAIEDGDILQVAKAILENQANQTAIMAQQADKEAAKENENKRNELTTKMLGERGEDGLYHGTMMSQYANMGLDIVNAFKHALYGDEYTTSQGVKVEKTDDHVLNTITGGMKKAGDVALSTVFGQDYKDKAAFKTAARFHDDLKSGLTATYNGERLDESQYVRGTYAEDMARRRTSASGVTTEEQKATEEALKETSQKALEINKNLVGTAKGALLGGLSFSAVGMLGGSGIIPSLLTPGGPLGGAIIGAGISILSRNNDFMNFMFGEEKDGERVGGLISKDMQERWKGLGSKLLGPAVLGAGAGFLFPKLVNLADGAVGSLLFGTGPIAGAALGVGASIIMRSKTVQDVLYGEEGKGGTTGLIGKMKTSMKDFWDKHKGQAKGMGLGAIGGALLAGTAGGGIGAILLSSAIGAGIGMKTGSDKFNEFLFGTKKFERDSNGKMVYVGRDGDGFVGKLGRMVSVNVLHPIEAYVRSASRDFAEWLRYDIGYQIKSIFEPFTTPIAEGMSAVAESLHNLTSKITKFIGKLTAPFRKILKGLLKLSGRAVVGTLKTGMTIAGQAVSAPLKMAGGIGRFITGKRDPEVSKHNKQFWRGYTDEDGTRHHSFLNPLARFKDAKGAFQRTESGFFDAVGNAARELNPFLAYGDARGRYAREHGLEDNSGFMGGFFGAAGKQHRDQVRENKRQTKQEQRLLKLSRKWAKDDKYNDKLVLSERELNKRNDKLRKILGPDYKDKSNADMMEFIYRDTFGEKAAKQEKLDDATVKTAEFLGDIKNITQGIFDYITGKIADAGDAVSNAVSSTTGGGSSRPNDTEAPTDEELEAMGNAIDIPLGRNKTVGEKIGQFGKKIGGLFSEKNKVGKFFDLQAAKMAGSEYTVEGGKIVKSFNADAKQAIRDYDEYTAAKRAEKQKTKEEKQADKDAKKLEKAAQKDIARTERKNAKEKRRAERAEIADAERDAAAEKKKKKKRGKLFDFGRKEPDGDPEAMDLISEHEQSEAAHKARKIAKTAKDLRKEKPPVKVAIAGIMQKGKLVGSSIFKGLGTLFGSKGALVGLGAVAVGAGITFLLTKFPDVLEGIKKIATGIKDWFVDTAWPFLRDTAWPMMKKIGEGIGEGVAKIINIIAEAPDKAYSFMNWLDTGRFESESESAAKKANQANYGVKMDIDTLMNHLSSTSGLGETAGLTAAEFEAKRLDAQMLDVHRAMYIYMGAWLMHEKGKSSVTAEDIYAFQNDSGIHRNSKLNEQYAKMLSLIGVPCVGVSYAGMLPSEYTEDERKFVMDSAVDYLNGEYGSFREAAVSATESIGQGPSHFMQSDPRWANTRYANTGYGRYSTMGNGGCGPTALANAAVNQGIHTNPMAVARLSRSGGYAVGGGTSAGLFTRGARRLGLRSTAIGTGSFKRALSNGNSIVFAGKGRGLYTNAGHIMSARGIDRRGNVIVDDPMRRHSLSVPLSTIGKGMTHAWSIGRGSDSTIYTPSELQTMLRTGVIDQDEYNRRMSEVLSAPAATGIYNPLVNGWNMPAAMKNGHIMYSMLNPLWAGDEMNYDSGTIGDAGCVLTSIGAMLANIYGLDYRPDFMNEKIATHSHLTLADIINRGIPKTAGASNYTGEVYVIHGRTPSGGYTNTSVINPNTGKGRFVTGTKGTWSNAGSITYTQDEYTFEDGMMKPFVVYGGTDVDNPTSLDITKVFYRPSDDHYYQMHAILAIPNKYDSENPTNSTYYLYDAGSDNYLNQAREITYKDLFNKKQGIERVLFLSGSSAFGAGRIRPNAAMINWMSNKYTSEEKMEISKQNDIQDSMPDISYYTPPSTNDTSSSDDEGLIAKITKALGGLGDIALGLLGRIFGGKGDVPSMSIYNANPSYKGYTGGQTAQVGTYNDSFVMSTGGHGMSNYYGITELTQMRANGLIDDYEFNRRMSEINNPKSLTNLYQSVKANVGSAANVLPYSSLPEWAKTDAYYSEGDYARNCKVTSSVFSDSDIDNIIATAYTIASKWEAGGKYNNALNDEGLLTIGISGFRAQEVSEIMQRMKASKAMSEDDAAYAQEVSDWAPHRTPSSYDVSTISNWLARDDIHSITKPAQDALTTQLQLYGIKDMIKLYETDNGLGQPYLTDPRSLIAVAQFTGYGQNWPMYMSEDANFRKALRDKTYSKDELVNTIRAAHAFYDSKGIKTYQNPYYRGGYINRWVNTYALLSGQDDTTARNVLGFGGGIADSFNSGSYDIVDTPVAIGRTPRVEVDSAPVTTRLDVIINYLRQIANTARQNRAETAATNLDIGHGATVEKRSMSSSGSNNMPATPVYTDIKNSDRMKAIHDRIARSPRPV